MEVLINSDGLLESNGTLKLRTVLPATIDHFGLFPNRLIQGTLELSGYSGKKEELVHGCVYEGTVWVWIWEGVCVCGGGVLSCEVGRYSLTKMIWASHLIKSWG